MTGYDAVLFDSDGILVEPPAYDVQAAATRDAFREVCEREVACEHVDEIVHGVTVNGLHEICRRYELEPEILWEARERCDEESQFEDFEAGSRDRYDDVDAIVELPQPRGVVSNNHHSTIEFVLDFFDLESLFDTYYGREKTVDSLRLKKPNTHYLERALADLEGESALYVGDSESDVIAARRAGMDSAFVRRPHCRNVDLSAEPTYDVADLREVVEIAANGG